MKKTMRNVRVIAEQAERGQGFFLYLDYSGQRELLLFHRRNTMLYELLKDGMELGRLLRVDPAKCFPPIKHAGHTRRRRMEAFWGEVRYLQSVVTARAAERAAGIRQPDLLPFPPVDTPRPLGEVA